MSDDKKRIFFSYSHTDIELVQSFLSALLIQQEFDPWFDLHQIEVGDRIAERIEDGLNASDYYVLFISKSSNDSSWVRQELETAFTLASEKKLSLVPVLLSDAPVPFQVRGLLYIDARHSLNEGIAQMVGFFKRQGSRILDLQPREIVRKSFDDQELCRRKLRALRLGDLRYHLALRLTLVDIKILWFDVFDRQMDAEIQITNIGLATVELLDRCSREELLTILLDKICRNHPRLAGVVA